MSTPRRHTRGATWNVERDRNRQRVVEMVRRVIVLFDLDWIALQETSDYLPGLHQALGKTHWIVGSAAHPGLSNTCLVIPKAKHPDRPEYVECVQMTRQGWTTVRGGKTPPKWLVAALLFGWIKVASVHYPPSVHDKAGGVDRLVGPAMRVVVTGQHAVSEVKWWRKRPHERSTLATGDRNNGPGTNALWSPRWIARQINGRLWYPDKGTHGHARIDGGIGRNVTVRTSVKGTAGSDHNLVVFDVTED